MAKRQSQIDWDWDVMAARLRDVRAFRHLTQNDVAERASIGASYISQIEAGSKTPTIDVFFNIITKGLEMSIGEFFAPWLAQEEMTQRQIEKESRVLFDRWISNDLTRRGIWQFLKTIDDAYARRQTPSQS